MPVAFVNSGTAVVGITSISIPHPASVVAGNLLIMSIGYKTASTNPVTPTGWQRTTSALGSKGTGIDGGDGVIQCFWKIAVGGETGNVTVTMTNGNSCVGRMFQYSKDALKDWQIPICYTGGYSVGATTWNTGTMLGPIVLFNDNTISVTNDNLILAGDVILGASGINSDGPTFSAQLFTATNTTFGTVTERQDSGTTGGQDCRLVVSEHPVTTSTFDDSLGNTIVYSMTASTSGTNFPAGGTLAVILREIDPVATTFDPFGMMGFFGI